MADYWISFRVTDDAKYNKRYNDLVDAINECATHGSWDGDTSLVCIRSEYTIGKIGSALKSTLNSTTDHLVIREIGKDSTRYINEPGDGFLDFFPLAKKL